MHILTVYLRPILKGHTMNKAMLSLITVFLLAACGQTGPLVLPQDAPATEAQPSDERTGQ